MFKKVLKKLYDLINIIFIVEASVWVIGTVLGYGKQYEKILAVSFLLLGVFVMYAFHLIRKENNKGKG